MHNLRTTDRRSYELALAYMQVKHEIVQMGFAGEIDWQDDISFDTVQESAYLREYAWVVLSCGMRESVVRTVFPSISSAFLGWRSASEIHSQANLCRDESLRYFRHVRKIDAILCMVAHVAERGFDYVKESIHREGISCIETFPFMGPATTKHLAKNIGIHVAKPDRHLERVARWTGYATPQILCETIADVTGDNIAVVDLVIWRLATLRHDYLCSFPASYYQGDR